MAAEAYQFRVTLRDISPPIWRRILVSAKYSFWDLHVAIQDAMGWQDYHLHLFRIKGRHAHKVTEIGIPDPREKNDVLPGWEVPLRRHFNDIGISAEYLYDFGDCWEHDVLLEGHLLREKGRKYPCCIGGERACPPEDCGGPSGYDELFQLSHTCARRKRTVSWLGNAYDPEVFDPAAVKFSIPGVRWKKAFLRD